MTQTTQRGDRWSVRLSALAGFATGVIVALPSPVQRAGAETGLLTIGGHALLAGTAIAILLAVATATVNRWLRRL
jgi:hypothetical protein